MPKTCSDPRPRVAILGPAMGTTWHAQWPARPGLAVAPVRRALQQAVERVDAEMSLWRPESDLCRLNRAEPGVWVPVPAGLLRVLDRALEIGRASGGAFEIAVGPAVAAWGFGPAPADPAQMRALLAAGRMPRAQEVLELDLPNRRVRKHAPAAFDLNGIAKGYGTDRLIEVLAAHGIADALAGIDGDLRVAGTRGDGAPWPVAVEAPDHDRRAAFTVLELSDAAVATSGDYRHWVEAGGRRLSHTIDPRLGGPLTAPPASVTVVAPDCMTADAWATALMVHGAAAGRALARAEGIEAMFLDRAPVITRGGL